MKTFLASSSSVEVNGETIYAIIDGMGTFKATARRILSDNGIIDPAPNQWYNQQAWLNAFREISEKIGDITLFNIGLKIPENANFPPDINSVHKAMASIDVAYHMNHRGGEIGNYHYEKTGENTCTVLCDNPYPDAFDKGIITAMGRKFHTQATQLKVEIDPDKPARSKGDTSTTFRVSW